MSLNKKQVVRRHSRVSVEIIGGWWEEACRISLIIARRVYIPGTTEGFSFRLFISGIFFTLVYIDKRYNNAIITSLTGSFPYIYHSFFSYFDNRKYFFISWHIIIFTWAPFLSFAITAYTYLHTHTDIRTPTHIYPTLLIVIIIIKCTLFRFFFFLLFTYKLLDIPCGI